MKALLLLAKAAIGFVWLVLILNIFYAVSGQSCHRALHYGGFPVHHARPADVDLCRRVWR